jgi:hypothetical protein
MKIKTILYNRTVNLGNYESKRHEATAEVEDGEDPTKAAEELRAFVHAELKKT